MAMRFFCLTFFVLSAQALKLVPQNPNVHERAKLIAKDAFDDSAVEGTEATMTLQEEMKDDEDMARKAVIEELDPTDFNEHRYATEGISRRQKARLAGIMKMGFVICMLGAAGVVAMLYWARGVNTVVAIAGYLMSLCTMSNMIRNIYVNYGFDYPQFVTASHGLCSFLVGLAILHHRQSTEGRKITVPTLKTLTMGLGPVAFCFALSLGSANLALLHANTHFYEMFSATNILCTFCLGAALGRPTSAKLFPSLMLVTFAVAIVAFGEVKFSALGAIFVGAGVLFRGLKAQIQAMLMSPGALSQSFDPVELVCWTSALTCVIMLVWSALSEGLAPWQKFNNFGVVGAVAMSCVNAVILNNAGLYVMREVGPLGQQIIGEMKGVLACLGAVAAFGEVITIQQILGYTLVIIGAQWYNRSHMQVQEEERAKLEAAVDKTKTTAKA